MSFAGLGICSTFYLSLKGVLRFDTAFKADQKLESLLSMTSESSVVTSIRIDRNLAEELKKKAGKGGVGRFIRKAVIARLGAKDATAKALSEDDVMLLRGVARQSKSLGVLLNQIAKRLHNSQGEAIEAQDVAAVSEIAKQCLSVSSQAADFLRHHGEKR